VHYHQLAYGHRRARRRSNDQLLPNAVRTDIELISHPHGMAYQATAPIPLWDPCGNHP